MGRYAEFKLKDWMTAIHKDREGIVLNSWEGEDLITQEGMAGVASLIVSGTTVASAFEWIAIGSGATAASTSDAALDEENVPARAKGTGSRTTTTETNDTAQIVYLFASGKPSGLYGTSTGTQAIEESGLFSEGTGGTLLCRQTFSALNIDWNSGDTLQITWKISVS